jgi:hypothetical protein
MAKYRGNRINGAFFVYINMYVNSSRPTNVYLRRQCPFSPVGGGCKKVGGEGAKSAGYPEGEGAKKWGVPQTNIELPRHTATEQHLYLRVWCRSCPVTYNRVYLRGCARQPKREQHYSCSTYWGWLGVAKQKGTPKGAQWARLFSVQPTSLCYRVHGLHDAVFPCKLCM